MSDIQQVKKDAFGIEEDDGEVMALLGDAISVTANILQVFGLGGIAQLIDKLQRKVDPVEASLNSLAAKMDAALHFEAAHDEDEHMFHVNDVIKDAESNWRTLVENNFNFDTPLINIALVEQNSSSAANELANKDIYWVRPFYDALAYRDGWFTDVDPPLDRIGDAPIRSLGPTLPQVFDYRLTMPTFLNAILIRTGFVGALRSSKPDVETEATFKRFLDIEVVPILNRLSATYAVIVAGLVVPPVPVNHEDFTRWGRAGNPGGVVDIYAGFGIVNQIGTRFIQDGLDQEVFRIGYQLNNLLKKKQYYSEAGLSAIWKSIQSLKPLLGQGVEIIDVEASLSAQEISGILGSILIDDPSHTLQFTTLFDIASRLMQVGRLGNLQPPAPVSRPLSLRSAIAAAVSQLTLLPQPVPEL